jgi:hypothetical protein
MRLSTAKSGIWNGIRSALYGALRYAAIVEDQDLDTVMLAEVELFSGRYWFTHYADGRGTVEGPFLTQRDAEIAKKKYLEKISDHRTAVQ